MKKSLIILSSVLALSLSACSSSSISKPEAESTQTTPTIALECIKVSQRTLEALKTGIIETADLSGKIVAVKAPDFKNVYFVAAQIAGEGIPERAIGVWSTNGDVASETMATGFMSVNNYAKNFSDWGDSSKGSGAIYDDEKGVAEAAACLSK